MRDDLWKVDIDVKTEQPSYGVPLEFVVKDGSGTGWDKMPDGTNYAISTRGSYILYEGQINPTTGKTLMLVSDLDDTMIGNDKAVSTASLCSYGACLEAFRAASHTFKGYTFLPPHRCCSDTKALYPCTSSARLDSDACQVGVKPHLDYSGNPLQDGKLVATGFTLWLRFMRSGCGGPGRHGVRM